MVKKSITSCFRSFKTEMAPNNVQRTLLLKHAGSSRWAYNWGLSRRIDEYKKTGKSLSAITLHKELVLLKNMPIEKGGIPWMYEISKWAPQNALRNLDNAFKRFFCRCKKGDKKKGFPKFKAKKDGIGSFQLASPIRIFEDQIQLPKIGMIRLKEKNYLPIGITKTAAVTEQAGRWFVSIQVGGPLASKNKSRRVIGIDVGISRLATLSDGSIFENPKALKQQEHLLRIRQKSVSRKIKGSNNHQKAVRRLARLHYRISNIRKDAIHKATSAVIAKQPGRIVIESLNVKGMLKNHKIAKALSDASMSEFLRQIKYKAEWNGIQVIEAPTFFPSSKMCYNCGCVNSDLKLSDRKWICPSCGQIHDRDLNAAKNLKKLAASSAATACCHGSSGFSSTGTKLPHGQEPNTVYPLVG